MPPKPRSRVKSSPRAASTTTDGARKGATKTTMAGATKARGRTKAKPKPKGKPKPKPTSTSVSNKRPKSTTPTPPMISNTTPLPTLLLDTGGYNIKHATLHPSQKNGAVSNSIGTSTGSTTSSSGKNTARKKPTFSPNLSAKPKHQLTTLLSSQIETIQNKSQLFVTRPMERGYITDLGTQFQIWDHILQMESMDSSHSFSNGGVKGIMPPLYKNQSKKKIAKKSGAGDGAGDGDGAVAGGASSGSGSSEVKTLFTHTTAVFCLTQPFTPRCIMDNEDEVWYRDFGFGRVGRRLGASCAAYHYLQEGKAGTRTRTRTHRSSNAQSGNEQGEKQAQHHTQSQKQGQGQEPQLISIPDDGTTCCCVVDSGFSMTSIVPTVDTCAIECGIRRINVGGKLLTNLLKQTISYRKFNMMDEFFLVNEAKEALCYVSMNFDDDVKSARDVREGMREFDREFILPDFSETFRGSVRLPAMLQRMKDLVKRQELQDNLIKIQQCKKESAIAAGSGGINSVDKDNSMKKTNETDEDDGGGDSDGGDGDNNGGRDDAAETNNNDEDEDDQDSDNETEEQARLRILKQREEERKRRELEQSERQALLFSVERFAIPEVLFRPSDIDMEQIGLAESIVQSIEALDPIYRASMYQNIVLTGGNVKIPFFRERLEAELRMLAPINYKIRIYLPHDPDTYAWDGAQQLIHNNNFIDGSIHLDRTDWEAMKESGQDGIWESKLNAGLEPGFTYI
mmetsp:Transcript_22179/g.33776  ORF Transcript_22179/g.33776 Transcript_22179/m.33776 type:complete len:737 (-) Transcript_22179:47-2257(-)